jgi:hypothetical protein
MYDVRGEIFQNSFQRSGRPGVRGLEQSAEGRAGSPAQVISKSDAAAVASPYVVKSVVAEPGAARENSDFLTPRFQTLPQIQDRGFRTAVTKSIVVNHQNAHDCDLDS